MHFSISAKFRYRENLYFRENRPNIHSIAKTNISAKIFRKDDIFAKICETGEKIYRKQIFCFNFRENARQMFAKFFVKMRKRTFSFPTLAVAKPFKSRSEAKRPGLLWGLANK